MKRMEPKRWNIAKRLLKRRKEKNKNEVKVQDIEPEIDTEVDTESANSSESRDCNPEPHHVDNDDIVFRQPLKDEKPKTIDGISPLLSLFRCGMDLNQVVGENNTNTDTDLLCGADPKRAGSDEAVLCIAGCTRPNAVEEPETTNERLSQLISHNRQLQNPKRDASERQYELQRVRRMDGGKVTRPKAKAKTAQRQSKALYDCGNDVSIMSDTSSSTSFDCIAKDEYLRRVRRSEQSLLTRIEEDSRTMSQKGMLFNWMTGCRSMGRNASESARQLAAELTMDESSLIPEEQSIYMIRSSSFLSEIIEKDSDGRDLPTATPTDNTVGKEFPEAMIGESRLSPLSEESQSLADELVALQMIHSRLLRDQAMDNSRSESIGSLVASSSSSSSIITDRGATLFYDMEMLRKNSKEPLYQYRDATTEESVKGHMVVFDITETMKEVVRVVRELQRDDLAGLLMVLLEDLVSTLGILKCGEPARRRLTKLKDSITERRGTKAEEKDGELDVSMPTEESKLGVWPDDEAEETPELELLKYSAADLKDEDPQLVLKRLKASLAVVRGVQREEYPLEELRIIKTSNEPITPIEQVKTEQAPGVILSRLKSSLAVLKEMKRRLRGSRAEDMIVEPDETPEVVLERLKSSLAALREAVSEEASKQATAKGKKSTPEVQLEKIKASLAALRESKCAEAEPNSSKL